MHMRVKLFNTWWTISNSKDQYCFSNYIGRAAIQNGKKPVLSVLSFLHRHSNQRDETSETNTFLLFIFRHSWKLIRGLYII